MEIGEEAERRAVMLVIGGAMIGDVGMLRCWEVGTPGRRDAGMLGRWQLDHAHRVIVSPWLAMKVALGVWFLVRHRVALPRQPWLRHSRTRPPRTTILTRHRTQPVEVDCTSGVVFRCGSEGLRVCEYRGVELSC